MTSELEFVVTWLQRRAEGFDAVIRRLWCRATHRQRFLDEGPGAVWCPLCGQPVIGR